MGLSQLSISLLLSLYAPPHLGYAKLVISAMPVPPAVHPAPEITLTRLAKMSDEEIAQFGREHGLILRRQDIFCKTAPVPKKKRPPAVTEGQPKVVDAATSRQALDCESSSAP